jgi:hypothetical protein
MLHLVEIPRVYSGCRRVVVALIAVQGGESNARFRLRTRASRQIFSGMHA